MSRYGFQRQPQPPDSGSPVAGIIGAGPAMSEVYEITRRVAQSNASVLLLGETGTGKELIAGAIHRLSDRNSGPFVKVNCGALSESLLESELFGHVRGAFTSAVANRTGRFEAAHSGTIFLDEINSTSLILQVKLLRVLQEREFERVGDTATITVDTRVIAASNRDLTEEVYHERFREDLYWRLNVVPIQIPPLRKRPEDIPDLVVHFLNIYSEANNRYVVHVQREALELMQNYHWPGNVRELQNYIERAVVMADGDELTTELLPAAVLGAGPQSRTVSIRGVDFGTLTQEVVQQGVREAEKENTDVHAFVVNHVEKQLIAHVLASCNFVQTKAAAKLGINRNTLHKKLKDYNLETPDQAADEET
ncbi:MAG: sigma-54-dependent Fis family transcriptional regulator [Planctomycetales bacterium]|nr:sigma-54-dependent Fis family transcriptional regulator [Planctomycetales bacterium]